MHIDSINAPRDGETGLICAAADLLRRMMLELQRLEIDHPRLTIGMATAGFGLRQRLDTLDELVGLLASAHDAQLDSDLARRAKALIGRLAGELEQLISQAEIHDGPSNPNLCNFDFYWQVIADAAYAESSTDDPGIRCTDSANQLDFKTTTPLPY